MHIIPLCSSCCFPFSVCLLIQVPWHLISHHPRLCKKNELISFRLDVLKERVAGWGWPRRPLLRLSCVLRGRAQTQTGLGSYVRSPAADEWVTVPLAPALPHSAIVLSAPAQWKKSLVSSCLVLSSSTLTASCPQYLPVFTCARAILDSGNSNNSICTLSCVQYSGNKACEWAEIFLKNWTPPPPPPPPHYFHCRPAPSLLLPTPGCWFKAFVPPVMHGWEHRSHRLRWSFGKVQTNGGTHFELNLHCLEGKSGFIL